MQDFIKSELFLCDNLIIELNKPIYNNTNVLNEVLDEPCDFKKNLLNSIDNRKKFLKQKGKDVKKFIEERRKVIVLNYLKTKSIETLIKEFLEFFKSNTAARFFKNANESTFLILLFDWFKQFVDKNKYDVQIEVNSPNGEIDFLIRSYPNSNVKTKILDIFEIKYIPKTSTDEKLSKELNSAFNQVNGYRIGEYQNYRGIAVVFRGNKDYLIKTTNT